MYVYICRVGQNHIYTVYIRYFWQGNHKTYQNIWCIYGAYIRSWPTLFIVYTMCTRYQIAIYIYIHGAHTLCTDTLCAVRIYSSSWYLLYVCTPCMCVYYIYRVGQNHILRRTYGIFGLKITKCTVYIYVYIQFWPTLYIYGLANPITLRQRPHMLFCSNLGIKPKPYLTV